MQIAQAAKVLLNTEAHERYPLWLVLIVPRVLVGEDMRCIKCLALENVKYKI